ncbi:bifunctional adenosylcobinamide kinase/adenosylcobinamide-phosphate guanylyltransferase [Elusimicrobiota bacterium]
MITLITGGIKSGKSDFALFLAEQRNSGQNFYFLATAVPIDQELKDRIEKHRKNRKDTWNTVEEPLKLAEAVKNIPHNSTVLLDCITLWIGNMMTENSDFIDSKIVEKEIDGVVTEVRQKEIDLYIVTNEVGSGIIPENQISRVYLDTIGKTNKKLACSADEVYLMTSGVDLKIKG